METPQVRRCPFEQPATKNSACADARRLFSYSRGARRVLKKNLDRRRGFATTLAEEKTLDRRRVRGPQHRSRCLGDVLHTPQAGKPFFFWQESRAICSETIEPFARTLPPEVRTEYTPNPAREPDVRTAL